MFLTKMVKDFLGSIKNSNQQPIEERPQQNIAKYKAKKPINSKKSHTKSSFNAEEILELPRHSTKKSTSLNGQTKFTTTKAVAPTKVKSGSWKRSEKSVAPFNMLTNKKHKNLRKKSPNWLKFTNSKAKIPESSKLVNNGKPPSACRPGTLYSDVLFGAGCSSLVKIKNLSPRHTKNVVTAQKKLTKALFKFSENCKNDTSNENEIEGKKNLFPVLQKINHTNNNNNNTEDETTSPSLDTILNQELPAPSLILPTKNEEANVILSDLKSSSLADNDDTDVSYSNYLKQYLEKFNYKVEIDTSTNESKFLASSISSIPKWNFTNAESGSERFPKFLGQFDDENYLNAEKIAWLGLKLALGNNSALNKF